MIDQLVEKGVDINAHNPHDEGWTALHYATQENNTEIVESLLRTHSANPNAKSFSGRTPLHISCLRLNKVTMERILLAGPNANIQASDGNTPLHLLAKYADSEEIVKVLLPFAAASKTIKNSQGATPVDLTSS